MWTIFYNQSNPLLPIAKNEKLVIGTVQLRVTKLKLVKTKPSFFRLQMYLPIGTTKFKERHSIALLKSIEFSPDKTLKPHINDCVMMEDFYFNIFLYERSLFRIEDLIVLMINLGFVIPFVPIILDSFSVFIVLMEKQFYMQYLTT